jgi:glycosyltransferase involved in cell wall biosynthesis
MAALRMFLGSKIGYLVYLCGATLSKKHSPLLNKVKIAFFAEILIEDFDGASRTMFQLIHRIPKDDFEFFFVCGVGPHSIEGHECLRIPAVTIPINQTYKMAVPWFSGALIRKKLAQFKPDVIHIATPSLLGSFALRYANRHQIPVLTIYHTHFISYIDYYLPSSPRVAGYLKSMAANMQRSFYSRCDRVYVPSEEMKQALLSWDVPSNKLQLWQRGIDTALFTPLKRNRTLVKKTTGNDHPVILFASRLVWEKNLETLIGIYEYLQERQLAYTVLIVGDGVALSECKWRMPNAIFTGKVDHHRLSELYASADVFVFTSISESYGNVVLEAMASGLPCVIADGGGSKNFIAQGENGFLCSPNQPSDYVARIDTLLQDKMLHQAIAGAALRYSQAFRWDDLADIYFQDMAQLAAAKRTSLPILP